MPCPDFDPTRCPFCPGDRPIVPPDLGPWLDPTDLLEVAFIGEAPGGDEDEQGRPFVGKTGQETNLGYLKLAGLDRDETYFTNMVKCRPRNNKTPEDKLIASCSEWHLKEEIRRFRPKVVVLMGATAHHLVPDIDIERHHGLPLDAEIWGHKCVVVPTAHPASGMYDTKNMLPLREDFSNLKRILKGTFRRTVDVFPDPHYKRIRNGYDLEPLYTSYDWDPIAVDTEYLPKRLGGSTYMLTFSKKPGTGYAIFREDDQIIKLFAAYMEQHKGRIYFHNGLADVWRLRELGIPVRWTRVLDTMQFAYRLSRFTSLKLKVLAYRLAGMDMQDFEDVVRPYAVEEAVGYFQRIQEVDWGKPEKSRVYEKGQWREKQGWSLNTYINRVFTDAGLQPPKNHKGPWTANPVPLEKMAKIFLDRWDEWPIETVYPAIAKFGVLPEPSIAQVPEKEAVWYGCRDADATLRVARKLMMMRQELRYTRKGLKVAA